MTDTPYQSADRKRQIFQNWCVGGAAIFLVSVPVFFQAPLVRSLPGLSLVLTGVWVLLSLFLMTRPKLSLWGDLILGFSWSWLAGSIYWGWLRWEPVLHLPIEAIGIPFALFCLIYQWGKVGSSFYLGSLLGTAITDLYFYLVGLIPHWRQIMQVPPDLALPILQSATAQVKTAWGISWVVVLSCILLAAGYFPLRSAKPHAWAFAGAVLGTILVDGLFWLAANLF